jgi:hypothetical protein
MSARTPPSLRLAVHQAWWAMDALPLDPGSTRARLRMLAEHGFEGVGVSLTDARVAAEVARSADAEGLDWSAIAVARSPRHFAELLRPITRRRVPAPQRIDLQAVGRPGALAIAVDFLKGCRDQAEALGLALTVETHRGRLTSDIAFTLALLDACPWLRLCADLSHWVVGEELLDPDAPEVDAAIDRALARADAVHGRVGTCEQIQVSLVGEPSCWAATFERWWRRLFEHRIADAASRGGSVVFMSELGPPPYAIRDPRGRELGDRWKEALMLADCARALWQDALEEIAVRVRPDVSP